MSYRDKYICDDKKRITSTLLMRTLLHWYCLLEEHCRRPRMTMFLPGPVNAEKTIITSVLRRSVTGVNCKAHLTLNIDIDCISVYKDETNHKPVVGD